MEPLVSEKIRGNWATILLPIDQHDQVDFVRLGEQMDWLVESGLDGLYSNGTSCEFYNQTDEEFLRISTMLAERCNRRKVPFQIGVNHPNPTVTLERVRQIKPLSPSAMQVILPDWFPPGLDEAVEFLRHVAAVAAPVGLVLYNPLHAKRVLSPYEIGRLRSQVPGLVGVKVVDGDDAWYSEMRRHAFQLSIFVPGHHLATGMSRGAAGSYSSVACLSPCGSQHWTNLMAIDMHAALSIEKRIRHFMSKYIKPLITEKGYSNQAVDKLLAAIGNWSSVGTRLRWPYRSVEMEIAETLRPVARCEMPELFE
jgi:dihydrodipicolinate synthase/N-acetylneuraminate lyase